MADIHINFQSQPILEPPEEDTLSLREFPVTPQLLDHRRSCSQPSEFFEFFTDLANSEDSMSHAEDIFFHGKLIPFKETHQMPIKHCKIRRRSESMSELKSTNNNSVPLVIRTSRSLDASTSLNSDRRDRPETIHRANSGKFKVPKAPHWLVLMFSPLKFPPEMDLRDIKSRQVRRNVSMTFPSFDARDGMIPVKRTYRKSSSWTILDVLGCQGAASVAV